MSKHDLTPKLFTLVRAGAVKEHITKDIMSGLIVGVIAVPLAIAFSIASGVSPEKGLWTAIIASLLVSVFGGSRVQIAGPTGAFVVIIFDIVQKYGIDGLTVSTAMAGFLIMLMGFLRMGKLLRYFPFTVILGFTTGIAGVIFTTQVGDIMGLNIPDMPGNALLKWGVYLSHIQDINYWALGIGLMSFGITWIMPKVSKIVPGSLIAIAVSALVVMLFKLPVETIGSRFGTISPAIPIPGIPHVTLPMLRELIQPAIAIALLGSIESLLSAVVADGMIGGNHRPNAELTAQGLANVVSSLFGGIPATGAIARTAANVKNGGRTPVAGIVHALVLFIVVRFASPLLKYIPLASLAGILVVVAYTMSEIHVFWSTLRSNKYDGIVLAATCLLTIVFDLVLAIEVGMVLAACIFVKRVTDSFQVQQVVTPFTDDQQDTQILDGPIFDEELPAIPEGVLLYEIQGGLLFGSAQLFYDTLRALDQRSCNTLVLRMRHVPMIDATGLARLKDLVKTLHHQHIQVLISGANTLVAQRIIQEGVVKEAFLFSSVIETLEWVAAQEKV